jgi:uncharacterized membrane protein
MSTLREDYEFIYRTIKHKSNKIVHYPAIKNLILIFEKKWKLRKDNNSYKGYVNLLKLALKKLFK